MNYLSDTLRAIIDELKKQLPTDTTSVNIFINVEGTEITVRQRSAEYLRDNNVSMKNISGEWIK